MVKEREKGKGENKKKINEGKKRESVIILWYHCLRTLGTFRMLEPGTEEVVTPLLTNKMHIHV